MCSLPSIKNFDALYAIICDRLHKNGKTVKAIEDICNLDSDYDRINWVVETLDSEVVSEFSTNIVSHYSRKDEIRARSLLSEACSQNSLPLINKALQLSFKEHDWSSEQLPLPINIKDTNLLQQFLNPAQNIRANENELVSDIFARRSAILFQYGKFECCIRDTFRCINVGGKKSYEIVLRLALSFKQLGYFTEAKLVAQHAIDILRSSSMDNESKSKETIRLVAIIKDIQQALSTSGNSGKNNEKDKVNKRQIDLFEGQHEILVSASSALELKYMVGRGRHVIANRNIPPGCTLIIEDPFAWSVTPSKYPSVCQYCLACEPSSSDGIPCPHCGDVIFCNEICRDKAIELFHKYECKILKLLDSSEKLGRMAVLCFRTVIQVDLKEILDTHNTLLDKSSPIMGLNSNAKFDSSHYASVFAQSTNSKLRNGADLLKRTFSSIYLVLCLRFVGYFNQHDDSKNHDRKGLSETEIIVASVLLRHFQSVSCNAYGVNHAAQLLEKGSRELEMEEVGGTTLPMISTTNHSCNPNIYRFNIGKKCIVNSLLEIKQGEEILDSYGPLFTTTSLGNRQLELKNQYCFECQCVACNDNWPTFEELRNPNHQDYYKCPYCDSGKLDMSSGKDNRKCRNCSKVVDFKKLHKILKSAEEKYVRAKHCVLKKKLDAYDNIQKCICNYILTIQKVMVIPTKELIEAQEVLKLFYNLSVRNDIIMY